MVHTHDSGLSVFCQEMCSAIDSFLKKTQNLKICFTHSGLTKKGKNNNFRSKENLQIPLEVFWSLVDGRNME
jgi:hypothetical protein